MIFRDLLWSDFDSLLETYYHLYEERAAGEPIGIHLFAQPPSKAEEVEWFANLYRKNLAREWICAVAEEGGRAVGSCVIQPEGGRRDSEIGHVGVLGILVDHRYRGRGAGTSLLLRSLEQARGQFEIVRLGVFANNESAKRLYRRMGFTTYGQLPRAIRRGTAHLDEEFMFVNMEGWVPPPSPNR
ncbi:MAG: GNAT family N-acetyltransferase [Thermoplasmata archaeon]|nr:GNAT family N-acetyltransferase [Thermoplasmata archaeon]